MSSNRLEDNGWLVAGNTCDKVQGKENGKYNKKIKTKTQKKENAVATGETWTRTACDSTDESGRSVSEPTAQT